MDYIRIIIKLFLVLTVALITFSCRPTGTGQNGTANSNDPGLLVNDSTNQVDTSSYNLADSSSTYYFLPSPDEIFNEIFSADLDVDLKYINSTENAGNYVQTKQQALNLGVYLSDLAFINIKGDRTSAIRYFKTARDLSLKLNIYQLFNEKTYNRIQNNLVNQDSLREIFKEVYTNLTDMLESSKRNNIYALVASGALIEALYLSTISIKNFSEYQGMTTRIFEQKYVIENFYNFAQQYGSDPNVKEVLILLFNLKSIVSQADTKTTEKSVLQKGKGEFVISGGEDIIITETMFNRFKEEVFKSREKIVAINN